jgi:2-desacetyl-2-hydroxyethyl bacteriochlorophyllide A dehydrogenase
VKALVFHGPKDLRWETTPDPVLESGTDALVRVTHAAICGSDLHLWHGGLPVEEPGFAVGHECVGVVEEVGSSVRTLRPGDRVFTSCTLGCGSCESCRRGLFSGCTETTAGGTRSNVLGFSTAYPGGQAERLRVPFADVNARVVPEGISSEQALFLTDILPTADMATEFAAVGPGDRVLVFGCGPVGTLAQRCARVRGAAQVIAVDLDESRLARARGEGCETIQPEREDLLQRTIELTGGRGVDAVIEAVGRPELVTSAATLVRPGGHIGVVGVMMGPVELPWALMLLKNLTVRAGLVNPQQHAAHLIALIEGGRLDPAELVTHRLPLADAAAGYELFASHRDQVLKVVLTP